MTNSQVCILGAGNMGRALLGGLLRAGTRAEHLSAAEMLPAARAALVRELGISAAADAHAAVAGAAVVVVAVKPQRGARAAARGGGRLARAASRSSSPWSRDCGSPRCSRGARA